MQVSHFQHLYYAVPLTLLIIQDDILMFLSKVSILGHVSNVPVALFSSDLSAWINVLNSGVCTLCSLHLILNPAHTISVKFRGPRLSVLTP